MSRHREIRNLNINDALDDDALSDGGEEDLTPEQQALMNDGLEQVRLVIGSVDECGISDNDIKDSLWELYFDIEQTIHWALEEQQRRNAAKERKDSPEKELPPIPELRELGYGEYSPPIFHPQIYEDEDERNGRPDGRSRVPLIRLAQQQGNLESLDDAISATTDSPRLAKKQLSTISERTERTQPSPHWPTRQQLVSLNLPRAPSSITTSYGQIIDGDGRVTEEPAPMDPNLIPVSPSGSALHRLSYYDPPPSMPPTESSSSVVSPRSPRQPLPPIDTIPDIPDYNSKSSRLIPPTIDRQSAQPPSKSKLSMLASSRASSITTKSESSRSSGTDVLGSVKTYPSLRPSPHSARPPSTVAPSSAPTSVVRKAIQTALKMEALDRGPTSEFLGNQADASPVSEASKLPSFSRPAAPTPSKFPVLLPSSESPGTGRQPSKLALLAQANKAARLKPQTPTASKGPQLPEEHTEYLTPIANGPTVTTAITTSYQSLYSLTDPTRSSLTRAPFVVPLSSADYVTSPSSPTGTKQSKLAMKIKKAQERHQAQPETVDQPVLPPTLPIFLPKSTRARASPSAFASLLVDDALTSLEDNDTDRDARRLVKGKMKERETPADNSPVMGREGQQKDRPRRRKRSSPVVPDFAMPSRFAFDVPSPDDVVFTARRGTSLAQQHPRTPAHVTKPFISKT